MSDRNPNANLKRWKLFVDEDIANIFFNSWNENVVADALSRQQISITENESQTRLRYIVKHLSLILFPLPITQLIAIGTKSYLRRPNNPLPALLFYMKKKTIHII